MRPSPLPDRLRASTPIDGGWATAGRHTVADAPERSENRGVVADDGVPASRRVLRLPILTVSGRCDCCTGLMDEAGRCRCSD